MKPHNTFITYLAALVIVLLVAAGAAGVKRTGFQENTKRPSEPVLNRKIEPSKPLLRSLSPYDIASFITDNPDADLRSLWNQLGIKAVNFGDGSISEDEQAGRVDRFLNKCLNCEVETFSCDLDAGPGKDVLLKVSDLLSESCRYLLFKNITVAGDKREWRLLGHIDHGFGRYKMPEHFIPYGTGRGCLVIKVQEGSGSGFAVYYDRVFQVEKSGIKEILRFPSEGHHSSQGYEPTLEFTTAIHKCEINDSGRIVELWFSVSYSAYSGSEEVQLWKKTQKAIYKTGSDSKTLVMDSNQSDLSQQEIDAVYGSEWASEDAFVKYNYADLARIASGREDGRKEWLRNYLSQAKESPQKQKLQMLLEQ